MIFFSFEYKENTRGKKYNWTSWSFYLRFCLCGIMNCPGPELSYTQSQCFSFLDHRNFEFGPRKFFWAPHHAKIWFKVSKIVRSNNLWSAEQNFVFYGACNVAANQNFELRRALKCFKLSAHLKTGLVFSIHASVIFLVSISRIQRRPPVCGSNELLVIIVIMEISRSLVLCCWV